MKLQWFVLFCDWLFLFGIYRSNNFAFVSIFFVAIRYAVVLVVGTYIYMTVDLAITPEYEIALNLVVYMLIDSVILWPIQFVNFVFKMYRDNEKR